MTASGDRPEGSAAPVTITPDPAQASARVVRNSARLGLGRGARGVLALLALVVAARALGVDDYGRLILLHGFVIASADLIKCQSWEALLRFGAPALAREDRDGFWRVLRFTLLLDVASAVFATTLLTLALPWLAPKFGFGELPASLMRAYAFVVAFIMLTSTPLGILRLLDAFGAIAQQVTLAPAVRLLGALGLWAVGAPLVAFVGLWLVSFAASFALLAWFAWRELRRHDLVADWATLRRPRGPAIPGLLKFALGTNVLSTLKSAHNHIALLGAGWLLDPAAAGLYHVARQCADVLVKPHEKLVLPALYPEFARLSEGGEMQRRSLLLRIVGGTAVFVGVIFAVLYFAGEHLLGIVFGAAFAGAYIAMLLLAVGAVAETLALPLEPFFATGGRLRAMVIVRLLSTVAFLAVIAPFTASFGLDGLAGASLLQGVLSGGGLLAVAVVALRGREKVAAS